VQKAVKEQLERWLAPGFNKWSIAKTFDPAKMQYFDLSPNRYPLVKIRFSIALPSEQPGITDPRSVPHFPLDDRGITGFLYTWEWELSGFKYVHPPSREWKSPGKGKKWAWTRLDECHPVIRENIAKICAEYYKRAAPLVIIYRSDSGVLSKYANFNTGTIRIELFPFQTLQVQPTESRVKIKEREQPKMKEQKPKSRIWLWALVVGGVVMALSGRDQERQKKAGKK